MDAKPQYTVDGLPIVSRETIDAMLHDIYSIPPEKVNRLIMQWAVEIDSENPQLSKAITMFSLVYPSAYSKQMLEACILSYKLIKSQMQNNKIIEMINDGQST